MKKCLLFTFDLASTEPHFLRLLRSEGVIDSLSLITYLPLRIAKGEMDGNNAVGTYISTQSSSYYDEGSPYQYDVKGKTASLLSEIIYL